MLLLSGACSGGGQTLGFDETVRLMDECQGPSGMISSAWSEEEQAAAQGAAFYRQFYCGCIVDGVEGGSEADRLAFVQSPPGSLEDDCAKSAMDGMVELTEGPTADPEAELWLEHLPEDPWAPRGPDETACERADASSLPDEETELAEWTTSVAEQLEVEKEAAAAAIDGGPELTEAYCDQQRKTDDAVGNLVSVLDGAQVSGEADEQFELALSAASIRLLDLVTVRQVVEESRAPVEVVEAQYDEVISSLREVARLAPTSTPEGS